MRYPFAIIPALLLAALGCLSVSHLEGFGFFVPVLFFGLCLPIVLGGSLLDGWRPFQGKPGGKGTIKMLAALVGFLVGWLAGLGINQVRILRAKDFAARAAPIILEFKKAHPELEELPERLVEIPKMPSVPDLMEPRFSMSDESGVRLNIINPYDYRKNWAYSSKTGEWIEWGL